MKTGRGKEEGRKRGEKEEKERRREKGEGKEERRRRRWMGEKEKRRREGGSSKEGLMSFLPIIHLLFFQIGRLSALAQKRK